MGERGPGTGRTWADLIAAFPVWLIGVALLAFVALMFFAAFLAERPFTLGALGRFGPDAAPAPPPASETPPPSVAVPDPLPAGIVVASVPPCGDLGDGWRDFEPGEGRMIIGVGTTTDEQEDPRTYEFDPNETGGNFEVSLGIDELPEHSHVLGAPGSALVAAGSGEGQPVLAGIATSAAGALPTTQGTTAPTGWGERFHILPPFIALHFCIRE